MDECDICPALKAWCNIISGWRGFSLSSLQNIARYQLWLVSWGQERFYARWGDTSLYNTVLLLVGLSHIKCSIFLTYINTICVVKKINPREMRPLCTCPLAVLTDFLLTVSHCQSLHIIVMNLCLFCIFEVAQSWYKCEKKREKKRESEKGRWWEISQRLMRLH